MENVLQAILDSITDEMENKYFVLCEYYNGIYEGRGQGYMDCAMVEQFGIHSDDENWVSHKDFETAFEAYDGKGYKVYHLREGMSIIFNEKLLIVNEEEEIPETFYSIWKDWFYSLNDDKKD